MPNASRCYVEQTGLTKAINSDTKVFVCRNLVKALPWFSQVRTKLEGLGFRVYSRYWVFFLKKARPTGDDATGQL